VNKGYGIVGCGNISRFHFRGLQKAGARIVHVADVNRKAAEAAAAPLGARVSEDYQELLEDPAVRTVCVLTGGRSHHRICLDAIRAGRHVICEKTLADGADEAREIVRAVRDGNARGGTPGAAGRVLFFVGFMKRFFPAAVKMKELLPRIGRIFSAQVRSYQPWGDFFTGTDLGAYSGVVDNYGGAALKCAGSHMLDMTVWMLGTPVSVLGHMDYVSGTRFDRKATALLVYADGAAVSFECAAHPLGAVGYERNGWDEWIQITGTGGRLELYTVKWDTPENNPALLVHTDDAAGTRTEYAFPRVNPFDMELQRFDAWIRAGEQGEPGVADGMRVDILIEAIAYSHEEGRAVTPVWDA